MLHWSSQLHKKYYILKLEVAYIQTLTGLGIHEPKQIERYSLRQEAHKGILKIYFRKQKGELFAALSLSIHDK